MSTEKERAYQRAYYLAHKDIIRARTAARSKKWYAENKDEAARISREYRRKNADKIAARKKAQRAETKDAQRAYSQKYHADNAERRNAKSREWHHANKESVAQRHAEWQKENAARCAERTRRRDAMKLKATPPWANREAIQAFYDEAARLTRKTGVAHTVDHIIPLQGKTVCGFHHEGNLQILTKSANSAKRNSFPADGMTL